MSATTIILSAATVLSAIAFAGIVWWAYGARRKSRFEAAARAPFDVPDEVAPGARR
jgi:cbb3-type cytochrome oxidase subunit 3